MRISQILVFDNPPLSSLRKAIQVPRQATLPRDIFLEIRSTVLIDKEIEGASCPFGLSSLAKVQSLQATGSN